ncbi:helix-turn-helix transcriptional regulator [Ancylobacter sp. Lp-2]|uniref:helix-turn-helix domain-containing protein n=1 Tax=Ancylobacter sp. Lp-2 TaxID=2881339 RepID=UPI001E3898ED|nr:helix-turn-helix transcriptional regulator [Ancylobacter sp. Lp-2]MCB4768260.1 helix-turn-helix transcriptional regulator [Ancylobacter sp. Lp-2]
MLLRLDRARLRSERRKRGWSQDQLAAISRLSVRTIQRLERGDAATPTSLAALALALSLSEAALVVPDGPVRRVTPLTICRDLNASRRLYTGLGFRVIETDAPGCIGLKGGSGHLILCTLAFMRGDYAHPGLDEFVDRTIPYIWVRSLDAALAGYANPLEVVETRAGTREALVEQHGQWAILAETPP